MKAIEDDTKKRKYILCLQIRRTNIIKNVLSTESNTQSKHNSYQNIFTEVEQISLKFM